MISFIQNRIVPQRLDVYEDVRLSIKKYGMNNIYPQLMIALKEKSGNTTKAIATKTKFLGGDGFEVENFNDEIVNDSGETIKDILNQVSYELSLFNGFALHFTYNALFEIDTINVIPWQYCRKGVNDHKNQIAVYPSWGGEYFRRTEDSDFLWIDKYNNDPVIIRQQIEESGGFDEYNGQILYYSIEKNTYPKVTFDSVRENVESDYRIMNWKKNGIKNGFSAFTVVEYPSMFESDQERNAFSRSIQETAGDENAGGFIVVENDSTDINGNHKPINFTPVQIQNIDKIFESTSKDIRDSIRSLYLIPPVLMGESESGLFNQDQMKDAYTYFNEMTKIERSIIEQTFSKFIPYYKDNINPLDNYTILVQEFGDSIEEEVNILNEFSDSPFVDADIATRQLESQANLKGSVGGVTAVLQIQNSVTNGTTSYNSGIAMLERIFGYSKEDSIEILGQINTVQ